MNARHVLAALALTGLAPMSFAATIASSSFDSSADGWNAVNGAANFVWSATGGDPGGYVQALDSSSSTLWFFAAPSSYLGNDSSAYGGTLSFALKSNSNSAPLATNYADVQLLGANGVSLALSANALPVGSWTSYSFALVANGAWKVGSVTGPSATAADFAGVLSDLKALRIRGDYRQAVEITGLDSVVLSSAPVPEPTTALMLLAGLGFVAGTAGRGLRQRNR